MASQELLHISQDFILKSSVLPNQPPLSYINEALVIIITLVPHVIDFRRSTAERQGVVHEFQPFCGFPDVAGAFDGMLSDHLIMKTGFVVKAEQLLIYKRLLTPNGIPCTLCGSDHEA